MGIDVENESPMDASTAATAVYQFGVFRLDVANRSLDRNWRIIQRNKPLATRGWKIQMASYDGRAFA
jgi:hypothetical protein